MFTFLKDAGNAVTNEVSKIFGLSLGQKPPDSGLDYNDIYAGGHPNKNWSKSLQYGFHVYDSSKNKPLLGQKPFILQIAPESLQQDEEFSIQFFPTPKGIVVEHQGSIMKDIIVSGTTGVHPKRGAGGVNIQGDVIFGSGDSGYKHFHDLRNYIRAYVESKKDPFYKNHQLVFFNFKDEEYYYVECTRFSLKRAANRPLMYDYTIALKTIGRIDRVQLDDKNGFFKLIGTIGDILDRVGDTISTARGIMNGSIDLLRTIDREIRRKILDPLDQLSLAIDDFKAGKTIVLGLPRQFLKDLNAQIADISNKLGDKSGVDMTAYNSIAGRTATLSAAEGREPTFEERQLIKSMNDSTKAINTCLSNKEMFAAVSDTTLTNIEEAYGGKITLERNNSTKTIQILHGDTIQDIATRELGNADKFKEIVVANNLKYPYIDDVAGDGVLSYDDKILIPIDTPPGQIISGVYRNVDWEITKRLPEAEKDLGVDIKLNKDKDIAVTNTNDVDLISTTENVIQTIGVMMGVEKGAYKLHTQFGISLNIGEKNVFTAATIKEQMQQMLLQDSRISPTSKVAVQIEGNTIYVTLYIVPQGSGQAVPLQLVSVNS